MNPVGWTKFADLAPRLVVCLVNPGADEFGDHGLTHALPLEPEDFVHVRMERLPALVDLGDDHLVADPCPSKTNHILQDERNRRVALGFDRTSRRPQSEQ